MIFINSAIKQTTMKTRLFLFFTFFSFFIIAQIPNYVPSDGLVTWWPFNGNAIDESGNGNDGINNGATLTTDRFGNPDAAYYFSSAGCATRIDADVNTAAINGQISMSIWLAKEGSGCLGPRIFEAWPGSNDEGHLVMTWSTGDTWPNSWYHRVQGSNTVGIISPNSGVPIPNSQWTNMIYTNDGVTAKIYQDGILICQMQNPANANIILASDIAIGRMNHPQWDAFEGKIDDIGIWNRALSACEVAALYSGQQANPPIVDLGSDTLSICGSSSSLDATNAAAGTYSWSNGEITPSITVNSSGLYSVAVTDTNGCIGYDTTFISLIDPTITASTETICIGDSTELEVALQDPCNTPEGSLSDGLLGWWPFCGNANDESGNGNNGTVNGATLTTDRFGFANSAYDFDGIDDEIIVNEVTQLDGTTTLTLSCWINLDDVTTTGGGGAGFVPIISKWGPSGLWPESSYILGLEDDKIVYNIDASQNIPNYPYTVQTPNNLLAQEWYHLVAQNDLNQMRIYINGQIAAVIDEPNEGNSDNNTELRFAAWWADVNSSYSNLDGRIDDVGLWDRILTISEIQSLSTMGQTDVVWSTSDTTSSIWVTPGATTTYSVTLDDGIGSCTDDIEITVSDPQIDFGGDQTICSGDDLELDAGAGYNYYNWSTGETTQTITVSAAGTYTATVGDSTPVVNDHSMSFDGQDDYVEINNPNIIDNTDKLSINFWLKTSSVNNSKVFLNKWSDPGTSTNRPFIVELDAGNNRIQFIVNGGAGFISMNSSIINLNQWNFISCVYDGVNNMMYLYHDGQLITQNPVSSGGQLMMGTNNIYFGSHNNLYDYYDGKLDDIHIWNTALSQSEIQNYMNCPPTGGEAGLVGYWNFEEGSGNTAIDQTSNGNDGSINGATYDTDTPEQVCVSCTATSDVVVTEAVPTSSTDTQEACESFTWIDGNTYTDDNTTATFVTTNAAGCDSTITLDLTILESSSSTDIHEVCDEFTWIDGNTYTENNNNATFTTTNTAGCDSVITLNLTINNLTSLDAGADQTVCEGTDVTLTATGAAVYDWDDDIQNGVPFPALLGTNTYTVEGTDANGCEDEQSVTITGTPYPELTFEVTGPACQGESSGNVVAVASNGTAPYSFVWNNGTLQAENNGITSGTYEVTVTDDIGCEAQGSVVVIDPVEPCFFIPGGLTPNGDGTNETWEIGGLSQYPDAKVMVYDRWGQQVYTGEYSSAAWDGTSNGKECPTADYYYILDLGDGQKFNGVVTLKR